MHARQVGSDFLAGGLTRFKLIKKRCFFVRGLHAVSCKHDIFIHLLRSGSASSYTFRATRVSAALIVDKAVKFRMTLHSIRPVLTPAEAKRNLALFGQRECST